MSHESSEFPPKDDKLAQEARQQVFQNTMTHFMETVLSRLEKLEAKSSGSKSNKSEWDGDGKRLQYSDADDEGYGSHDSRRTNRSFQGKSKQNRGSHKADDNLSAINTKIPFFQGKNDPEAYVTWENKVEKYLNCHAYTDKQQVHLVVNKLTDYAAQWWYQERRERRFYGERQISTWSELRRHLRKLYAPSWYRSDCTKKERTMPLIPKDIALRSKYHESTISSRQSSTRKEQSEKLRVSLSSTPTKNALSVVSTKGENVEVKPCNEHVVKPVEVKLMEENEPTSVFLEEQSTEMHESKAKMLVGVELPLQEEENRELESDLPLEAAQEAIGIPVFYSSLVFPRVLIDNLQVSKGLQRKSLGVVQSLIPTCANSPGYYLEDSLSDQVHMEVNLGCVHGGSLMIIPKPESASDDPYWEVFLHTQDSRTNLFEERGNDDMKEAQSDAMSYEWMLKLRRRHVTFLHLRLRLRRRHATCLAVARIIPSLLYFRFEDKSFLRKRE